MEVRVTKLRVAMAALCFVLAGVGLASLLSPLVGTALATVGTVSNISDRSASAFFAKVSSDGKLAIGDGAGPLSVDGTVSGRSAAPASPWRWSGGISVVSGEFIAGPSASPINITSLSLSTNAAIGSGTNVYLTLTTLPLSATSCAGAVFEAEVWRILDAGDGMTPLSFDFPTPLQAKPPANKKACLFAQATDSMAINAVGFYGG